MARFFKLSFSESFAWALIISVVTAWFSQGFYHYDEHFQVLEFLGYKLDLISSTALQWEFQSQSRSFAQPFLYYLFLYPMKSFLSDPHLLAFICRLVSALFGCCSFYFFVGRLKNLNKVVISILPYFFFLPFFWARTSSESFAASSILFAAGFCLESEKNKNLFLAGVFSGLAFVFRYQSVFLIFGMIIWFLKNSGLKFRKLMSFAIAGLLPIAAEFFINRWGFGNWVFVPWRYFDYQILRGVAAGFGASPWYEFLPLLKEEFGVSAAILTVVLFFHAIWDHRQSLPVFMAVPFIVGHSLMAHKELRFLFPAFSLLVPYCLNSLIEIVESRISKPSRRRLIFAILWVLNLALFIKWDLLPQKDQVAIARNLNAVGNEQKLICFGEDLYHIKPLDVQWYRDPRKNLSHCQMRKFSELNQTATGSIIYVRFESVIDYLNFAPERSKILHEDFSMKLVKGMSGILSPAQQENLLRGKPLRLLIEH